jgi:hypothetical protein
MMLRRRDYTGGLGPTNSYIWRWGHLDLCREGRVLQEVGLSPRLSPFWAFSVEVPLLSTMVASSDCKPQLDRTLPECFIEVTVFLVFFPPFSNVLVLVYRHG